jgi:hypothetical protein
MLLDNFSHRAEECLILSKRAGSTQDPELFSKGACRDKP